MAALVFTKAISSLHVFFFQDKKDIPWWLGISNKGIGVYDKQDKNVPRRVSPKKGSPTFVMLGTSTSIKS